jgi:DNA-binding transcriptional MerR regulator
MWKAAGAFRSIGEVADLIGVAPHVLRYWETQFSQLKPMKRPDGRRYYRPDDVRLAAGLCEVLREEGLTIRGAKKLMGKDRGEAIRMRGDQRLAGAMGSALTGPVPLVQDSPQLPTRHAGPQAEFADPVEDDPLEDQPAHAPRTRHRRRPHGHPHPAADRSSHGNAPGSFPDDEQFLPRLVALASQLRALPHAPANHGQLQKMAHTLREHFGTPSENSSD